MFNITIIICGHNMSVPEMATVRPSTVRGINLIARRASVLYPAGTSGVKCQCINYLESFLIYSGMTMTLHN